MAAYFQHRTTGKHRNTRDDAKFNIIAINNATPR